jgi:hypothetical protein
MLMRKINLYTPMGIEQPAPINSVVQSSLGFAFSPADIERGGVFEFKLNHVVEVDDPLELVRIEWVIGVGPVTGR